MTTGVFKEKNRFHQDGYWEELLQSHYGGKRKMHKHS